MNGTGNSSTYGNLAVGGTYSVSETTVAPGWSLTTSACTIDGAAAGTPAAITVQDGKTTICTFTNTENEELTRGKIQIVKVTDPASDTTTLFPFTRSYDASALSLAGGGSTTSGSLVPATYTIAEGALPSGWTLSNISCVATRTAAGNSDPTTSVSTVTSPGVSIALGGGDTVTCTYTNTKKPTLTLVKAVTNDNGGTALDSGVDAERGRADARSPAPRARRPSPALS